jgi:hypothetical protein
MSVEAGTEPPDQFKAVAQSVEVVPVQTIFAAFAVGTRKRTSAKNAPPVERRETRLGFMSSMRKYLLIVLY